MVPTGRGGRRRSVKPTARAIRRKRGPAAFYARLYRLRHFPSERFDDVIEACLWAGTDAVASHDTVLAVYGLGDAMPGSIHITVLRRLRKERRSVIVHVAIIADREIETCDYVAVTTIERTIKEVARLSTPDAIDALTDEAEHNGLLRHKVVSSLWASLRHGEPLPEQAVDGLRIRSSPTHKRRLET